MAKKKVEKVKYPGEIYICRDGDGFFDASDTLDEVMGLNGKQKLVAIYELKEVATFMGKFERVD